MTLFALSQHKATDWYPKVISHDFRRTHPSR